MSPAPLCAAGPLFLLLAISFILHPPPRADAQANVKYMVFLDAGSTGTRTIVYQITPSDSADAMSQIQTRAYLSSSSVVSNYAADPAGAITSIIAPGVMSALQYVPEEARSDTSIFVLGAASMRLLPVMQATTLIETIRTWLQDKSNHPFRVDADRNVRIMSGSQEEAVMEWLAINYGTGYLQQTHPEPSGIFAMHGASAQLAFTPDTSILDNSATVGLPSKIHTFYSHSYLRYGQRSAINVTIQIAVENSMSNGTNATVVNNPCMMKGESIEFEGRTVNGTGDPDACMSDILMDFMYIASSYDPDLCWPRPCAIGPVYQPPIPPTQKIYITNSVLSSIQTLLLQRQLGTDGSFSVKTIYDAAKSVCSTNINDVIANHLIAPGTDNFVSMSCLTIGLMKAMFVTGFGVSESSTQLFSGSTVNNTGDSHPIEYTVGAVIYEMSLRPPSSPPTSPPSSNLLDALFGRRANSSPPSAMGSHQHVLALSLGALYAAAKLHGV